MILEFFKLMQTISQEDFVFMFTIISFILTILGCINWLMVGLLQYDFVAGIFGYQASILSRIVYIIIGASSLFLVYKLIKGKGTIAVFSRRNKRTLQKIYQKCRTKMIKYLNKTLIFSAGKMQTLKQVLTYCQKTNMICNMIHNISRSMTLMTLCKTGDLKVCLMSILMTEILDRLFVFIKIKHIYPH